MKIHQVVLFVVFFFTAVCSGNDASTYTGVVGGNGTITCYFSTHLFWKFFCRNECKDEDTLIQIDRDSGRSGRYKIKYEREASRGGSLSVTISNLTKVDSGSYQCGLKEESVRRTRNLTITVLDAVPIPGKSSGFIRTLTEGKTFTRRCGKLDYEEWKFFCRGECQKKEDVLLETVKNTSQNGRYSLRNEAQPPHLLYVTITQVNKADTGSYRCGYGRALSSVSYKSFPLLVLDDPQDPSNTAHSPAYILPLVLIVPLVLVLLAVFLVLFYKRRTRRDFNMSTAGNADRVQVEVCAVYENLAPFPTGDDAIYQNITPADRSQDKCLD